METKKSKVIFVIGMLADKTALSHYIIISLHIVFIIDKYPIFYCAYISPRRTGQEAVL